MHNSAEQIITPVVDLLPQNVSADQYINRQRATLPHNLKVENIHRMLPDELLVLQRHLGFEGSWGTIIFPDAWWPQSYQQCDKTVRIHSWLQSSATSNQELELGVITAVRMFLLCICAPSHTRMKGSASTLAPTTANSRLKAWWIPLIRDALTLPARDDGLLLARLSRSAYTDTNRKDDRKITEIRRFDNLASQGLWRDTVQQAVANNHLEGSYRGKKKKELLPELESDPFRPLPDSFVHAMGQKASWITENLTPSILEAFESIISTRRGSRGLKISATELFLQTYEWRTPKGHSLEKLPFQITGITWPPRNWEDVIRYVNLAQAAHYFIVGLSAGPRASEILDFKTDCLVEARDGIAVANGRTFKIVDPVAGATRSWPMPRKAVAAIYQQIRLSHLVSFYAHQHEKTRDDPGLNTIVQWQPIKARLLEIGKTSRWLAEQMECTANTLSNWSKGSPANIDLIQKASNILGLPIEALIPDQKVVQHLSDVSGTDSVYERKNVEPLWRIITSRGNARGKPLSNGYNDQQRNLVDKLGLADLLDDQALTNHRFRKTIARLVALCYVHAPKILMDIFGHEDIDMTLHYILSDDSILADIEAIHRELKIIKAEQVISTAFENGGVAAKKVIKAVESVRSSNADFGADDVHDLAIKLTFNGQYWEFVRPGVICTKLQDEVGPCNKGKSKPNPARCNTGCDHRLEQAENRQEAEETLEELIKLVQQAWARNDTILSELWAGQLITNLKRFDDLAEKWSKHKVVAQVLEQL